MYEVHGIIIAVYNGKVLDKRNTYELLFVREVPFFKYRILNTYIIELVPFLCVTVEVHLHFLKT